MSQLAGRGRAAWGDVAEADRRRIREMYEANSYSTTAIADLYGVTSDCIRYWLKVMGVHLRRRGVQRGRRQVPDVWVTRDWRLGFCPVHVFDRSEPCGSECLPRRAQLAALQRAYLRYWAQLKRETRPGFGYRVVRGAANG